MTNRNAFQGVGSQTGGPVAHTYSRLLVHVVFSTKERRPMLDAELKRRLLPYLGGIAQQLGSMLYAVNGPTDHLHLLAHVPRISHQERHSAADPGTSASLTTGLAALRLRRWTTLKLRPPPLPAPIWYST